MKYLVFVSVPGEKDLSGRPATERVPHIEGKLCKKCCRILPLSHQGPCPCGSSEVLLEAIIVDDPGAVAGAPKPADSQTVGGTD